MKTNKEIVTEIIEDLESTVRINWPTDKRVKVTRAKLIECWSVIREEPDWEFYGYKVISSTTRAYRAIFKNMDQASSIRWKTHILELGGHRYCSKCEELKSIESFNKDSSRGSGIKYSCKSCEANYYLDNKEHIDERNKKWSQNNLDKVSSYQKTYRKDNKEKIIIESKLYRKNNKKKEAYRHKIYRQNNPDKINANVAKYRAAKLNRTPSWLTEKEEQLIKDLYSKAKDLEKIYGINYHVDHIIPLQGKLVSGLHIPSNLQIITAKDNLSKGNTYII